MGAITRAAANNITTGGVILPAGINDASVASISALSGVSTSDGITLISSQTASASSSISFTTGIDSTYRTYLFKFININPATDNTKFGFNFSTDGGSNYNVTKTSASFDVAHSENDVDARIAYDTGGDLAQSTGYQIFGGNLGIGSGSDESLSGEMFLFNPSSTTYIKHFIARVNLYGYVDYSYEVDVAGYGNTTSAINAIDFKMTSGNFDGTIHMYGIN